MTMLGCMTRFFPVFTAVFTLGCLANPAFSQTPGGRTALAAKQHLKNEVLDAMSDGKISNLEKAEILAEAKEFLTVKEYEGLIATMDRLSPQEQAVPVAKRSANERAIAASMHDRSGSPMFLSRMLAHVPYIDDLSLGPHPQVSNIASGIPYAKPRDIDLSGVKQTLAKAPRLNDTYIERPTADRPLPRITHAERTTAPNRMPVKPFLSRRNQIIEKQPYSKYADESISPLPKETDAAQPDVVQQPGKVLEEMDPLAGMPSRTPDSPGLATPAGALLPDRSIPSTTADYSRPVQPQSVELEFLR